MEEMDQRQSDMLQRERDQRLAGEDSFDEPTPEDLEWDARHVADLVADSPFLAPQFQPMDSLDLYMDWMDQSTACDDLNPTVHQLFASAADEGESMREESESDEDPIMLITDDECEEEDNSEPMEGTSQNPIQLDSDEESEEESDVNMMYDAGTSQTPMEVDMQQRHQSQPQDMQNQNVQGGSGVPNNEEVDVRDIYTYHEIPNERLRWKTMVHRRTYRVKFVREVHVVDDIELHATVILDLISREIEAENHTDSLLGVRIEHPSVDIYTAYVPIEAYNTRFLCNEIDDRMQSNTAPLTHSKQMDVTLTLIKKREGGSGLTVQQLIERSGRAPPSEDRDQNDANDDDDNNNDDDANTRTNRNVADNNVAELCLGMAVVQAMAYIAKLENASLVNKAAYKQACRVSDDHPLRGLEHRQKAERILREAGIQKRRDFTISEDVERLQAHYRGRYQFIVMTDEHDSRPSFSGPFVDAVKVIALLLKGNHYQHIRKQSRFLGKAYFCSLCNKSYNQARRHYTCPLRCRKCLRIDCQPTVHQVRCETCSINFHSQGCYDAHNLPGPRQGRTRCAETKVCRKCTQPYYIDKNINHVCGQRYCTTCKTEREPEHRCMMSEQPYNADKIKEKRIFFDFECTAQGVDRQYHKAVLAMALRCCAACRDEIPLTREEALNLSCASCSPDGKRFWTFECVTPENADVDVLDQFGRWLFNKRHRDFVIIAHNLKGYDGQFILQHLFKEGTPKPDNLVLDGSKVNFANVAGLRMLDSFNFVPFGLATFSKSFGIETLTKGDFPVLFIKPENYGYVGPMPPQQFYPDSEASTEKRDKFMRFYTEQTDADHVFDFKKELFEYCYADVALLAASMIKFEAGFFSTTNVMLFEESVTSASAAVKTFRRNFLKPDEIALDMAPVGSSIKQSAVASRYLMYREERDGIPIQAKHSGGEYRLPGTRWHMDGYIAPCEQHPMGLAIEVKGCYWHAHDCLYKAEAVVRDDMTAKEIRERDELRERAILQQCALECVWECEIENQRRVDKCLDKCLTNNTRPGPVIPSEALYGGRTEPIRLIAEATSGTELKYKDFTSLYPAVMKYCSYPIGSSRALNPASITVPINSRDQLEDQMSGIVSCKVLPPQALHIPVLPYRWDQKLLFPLCAACAENETERGDGCQHVEDERCLRGTYTTPELALALENGYVVKEVYGVLHWDNWKTYSKDGANVQHGIFSSYVDAFLKLKQEASGFPASATTDAARQEYLRQYEEQEGIRLTAANIKKDEVMRQVAKLLLNSLWGKLGQRTVRPQTHILSKETELHQLVEDPTIEIRNLVVVSESKIVVFTRKLKECTLPLDTSAMPYAVFTTSHARIHLYRSLEKIPEPEQNILYMDTDSVIYRTAPQADPLPCGNYLGELTDELPTGSKMLRFVTTGPKSYAFEEQKEDGTLKIHLKMKGFAKTANAERQITMALMQRQVQQVLAGDESPETTTVLYKRIERDQFHRLFNREQQKKFRFTFNKRTIKPDGGTLPIGHI